MDPAPCPSAERLVLLLVPRALPSGERSGLLAHAEACADCRADLAAAAHALRPVRSSVEEVPRIRLWAPVSAAAVLVLLSAGWLRHWDLAGAPPSASPGVSVRPTVAVSSPFVSLPECCLPFGASGLLTLCKGSRAELKVSPEGREVLWESGGLLVESRGDSLRVRAGPLEVLLEDADLRIGEGASPAAWSWMAEALAGESLPRVRILRGTARVRAGGREVSLSAGQEAGADLIARPFALPTGRGGWKQLPGLPVRARDATLGLAEGLGGRDFVWEALVRRSDERTLFELLWSEGKQGWHMPFGHGTLGNAGPWIRLRLERRLGWVRVLAAGQEVLVLPASELSRCAYPCPVLEGAPGIRVWGGDIEVGEARWRELP